MRSLAFLSALSVGFLAVSQGYNGRYDAFENGFAQESYGVEINSTGAVAFSGSADYDSISSGSTFFHLSVVLTQLDQLGNKLWEKRTWRPFHSSATGWANSSDTIPGGGYVVGGASEDTLGNDEVYLMRFDTQGDTLWTRVFGDPNLIEYWIGRQVKYTTDGGFMIVGDRGGANGNGVDAFLIKTDNMGFELWRRSYGGPFIDGFVSLDKCAANSYFTGGVKFLSMTNSDLWVQRVDQNGNVVWSVSWGGEYKESNAQLSSLSDGNAFVAGGWSYAPDFALMKPYLAKIDSADGGIIWDRTYGPEAYSTTFFVGKEAPNGDLIAAGVSYANSDINNVQQGLLLRTTSEGDSLWMFNYFYQDDLITEGQGRFYDVLPTPDGGFVAAGAAYNPVGMGYPAGYSQDTWVVKVDGQGCIVPGCNSVGVVEQATNLLGALTLFPNPVTSGQPITVQLELPPSVKNEALQLTVVDAIGKVVHTQQISAGAHALSFGEGRGVALSGVYYVHIAAGGKWLTGGKFVVE